MTRRSVSQENLNSVHLTPHTDLKVKLKITFRKNEEEKIHENKNKS